MGTRPSLQVLPASERNLDGAGGSGQSRFPIGIPRAAEDGVAFRQEKPLRDTLVGHSNRNLP